MANFYRKVAGIGTGTGIKIKPVDAEKPPAVSIIRVSVIDIAPDAQGIAQKRITVTYATPDEIAGFSGLWVYLDAPDSAGGLNPSDGTSAANGTVPAAGRFAPEEIGFFAHIDGSPQFSFVYKAPARPEFWRAYIVPGTLYRKDPVVQVGLTGESESFRFLVQPPAAPLTGREFAPLVRNLRLADAEDLLWDENPLQINAESGDRSWVAAFDFDWPEDDQNIQTLGGVNFVLSDGLTQTYIGNVEKGKPGRLQLQPQLLKPGTTNYELYALSYSSAGKTNTLFEGITPSVTFTITRQEGNDGVEYTSLVTSDGVNPLVTVEPLVGADGTQILRVTGYFNAPDDPTFGGIEIAVKRPDGDTIYTLKSGRTAPVQVDISQPAEVELWRFYLVSIDTNNRRNSIKDDEDGTLEAGETPWIDISVGNASGQLNLSKARTDTFDTDLAISGGKLTLGNVSATKLVTGILQVGGGGSKVSIMKIFDGLGSLIGWWGDDTGVSGYVGGWAKEFRIGGSSPATAKIVSDASGNLNVSTSLLVGTFPAGSLSGVIVDGQLDYNITLAKLAAGTLPGTVIYGGTVAASQILGGTITAVLSLNSGGTLTVYDAAQFNGNAYFNGSQVLVYSSFQCFAGAYIAGYGLDVVGRVDAGSYKVGGVTVISGQASDPGSPSFSSVSDAQTWCASLRTNLRAIGLVA